MSKTLATIAKELAASKTTVKKKETAVIGQ